MEVKAHRLIEVAFKQFGVPARDGMLKVGQGHDSNIAKARHLSFLLLHRSGMTSQHIAELFNVANSSVCNVIRDADFQHITWKNITMRKNYFEALSTISGN